jgi:hypothetical protein
MGIFGDHFRKKARAKEAEAKKIGRIQQEKKTELQMRVRHSERIRVESILALPEARGNPELAAQLAYESGCSVSEAQGYLAKFGKPEDQVQADRDAIVSLIAARRRR